MVHRKGFHGPSNAQSSCPAAFVHLWRLGMVRTTWDRLLAPAAECAKRGCANLSERSHRQLLYRACITWLSRSDLLRGRVPDRLLLLHNYMGWSVRRDRWLRVHPPPTRGLRRGWAWGLLCCAYCTWLQHSILLQHRVRTAAHLLLRELGCHMRQRGLPVVLTSLCSPVSSQFEHGDRGLQHDRIWK